MFLDRSYRYYISFFFFPCILSFAKPSNIIKSDSSVLIQNSDTTFHLISAADKSFGYEILVGKKALIKQITIPGRPGLKGFKTKKDAEKVALLMIRKLKKGIMPPTVEKDELDKLKIHY